MNAEYKKYFELGDYHLKIIKSLIILVIIMGVMLKIC